MGKKIIEIKNKIPKKEKKIIEKKKK